MASGSKCRPSVAELSETGGLGRLPWAVFFAPPRPSPGGEGLGGLLAAARGRSEESEDSEESFLFRASKKILF